MSLLNFFFILLIVVIILSSMASTCVVKPATELLYNGMYPYTENFSDSVALETPLHLHGFDGLMSSPGATHNLNDLFIGTKSDAKCESYGYMNSTGNLCLNDHQIKLIKTRGGNGVCNCKM